MHKVSFALCVASATVASFFCSPAHASDKKNDTPEPTRPFISGVNGNSVTVTTGSAAKTLTVKSNSEVLLNGQKAAAADLKVGMIVNSVGMGTDPTVISRISVVDAPPAPPTGRKKK